MFSFLKSDPSRRLRADYKKLVQKAYDAQQNGDIRGYSLLTAEAEKIKAELDKLEEEAK
ncbi:MAG: hypothetical protein ACJAXW_001630 [Candidatus Azotimanducaceae bacterium]|jgi:hypothetical protein